jgi:Holliday junction DNA helicase RuvA
MISQLKGVVDSISLNKVTLDVSGVGYELICSAKCLQSLTPGDKACIVVYTHVREDAIILFGFEDHLEKQVFLLLHSVQGVGPRSAAEIISNIDKVDLLRIIGLGEAAKLQRIKGIGKKLSERIVVELKDKVAEFVNDSIENAQSGNVQSSIGTQTVVEDAVSALIALGFARKDAEKAMLQTLEGGDAAGRDSGQLVRDALRFV